MTNRENIRVNVKNHEMKKEVKVRNGDEKFERGCNYNKERGEISS